MLGGFLLRKLICCILVLGCCFLLFACATSHKTYEPVLPVSLDMMDV